MKVYKIEPIGFAANSYILTQDGKSAVLIDPSQPRVIRKCEEFGLTPEYVLLTHGHFDHVGACGQLFNAGVKIFCGEQETDFIKSEANRSLFGGVYIPEFEAEPLKDGSEIALCSINFKVIATPGHSAGSVCYVANDCVFSGDTLFCGSVGRSDLPTGNAAELSKSVKKLYSLEGDFKVYCGHDGDTTLNYERKNNAYVRQDV